MCSIDCNRTNPLCFVRIRRSNPFYRLQSIRTDPSYRLQWNKSILSIAIERSRSIHCNRANPSIGSILSIATEQIRLIDCNGTDPFYRIHISLASSESVNRIHFTNRNRTNPFYRSQSNEPVLSITIELIRRSNPSYGCIDSDPSDECVKRIDRSIDRITPDPIVGDECKRRMPWNDSGSIGSHRGDESHRSNRPIERMLQSIAQCS